MNKPPKILKEELPMEDRKLVERVVKITNRYNRNNVTRTKAYFDFYKAHPEIHWAFLGHMVSRNGGWNMTDLQGEFLPHLLSETERQAFFLFLERGNWLIFQDAFPQFLLYEESLKKEKSFFYLLPVFQISTFMEIIWNFFLRNGDRYVLTVALIINEQSYLEQRVIQNPIFKKTVFNTLEFKLQDLFSISYILFPYENGNTQLVGQTLQHFDSLDERIKLGKRLYALLYQNKDCLKGCLKWANTHLHTGSRGDYWPHVFHHTREDIPGKKYQMRVHSCQIRKGAPRLFSPELVYTWKDIGHSAAEPGDWFNDWRVIEYLIKDDEQVDGEVQNGYCKSLEKLELAAIAKKALAIFD